MNNEILYFLNLHHNLNFNTQQLEQDYKNANVKHVRTDNNIKDYDDFIISTGSSESYSIKQVDSLNLTIRNPNDICLFNSTKLTLDLLLATCSSFSKGLVIYSKNSSITNSQLKHVSFIHINDVDINTNFNFELIILLTEFKFSTKLLHASCIVSSNSLYEIEEETSWTYKIKDIRFNSELYIYTNNLLSTFIQRSQLSDLDIYIISLHKSIDRRLKLKSVFDSKKIDFKIHYGINGANINVNDCLNDQFKTHIKDQYHKSIVQLNYYNRIFFNDVNARNKKMSYGGFGCSLSHIDVYYNIIKNNKPALIFEDDACINNIDLLISQINNLPSFKLWDLCFLQNEATWWSQRPIIKINDYFGLNMKRGSNRAHCYIVTPIGAQKILSIHKNKNDKFFKNPNDNKLLFVNIPADDFLSRAVESDILTTISPYERCVPHNIYGTSDIWNCIKENESDEMVLWNKPTSYPFQIVLGDITNGRLGNQMFVFATALTLALKTNSRIVIESKIINAKITLKNVFKNIYWDEQVIIKPTKSIVENENQDFIPSLLNITKLNSSIELLGYFQNPKYWRENISIIKEIFQIRDDIKYQSDKYMVNDKKIPISVHLRMPDTPYEKNFIYYTWTIEELNKAIIQMKESILDYSDDKYIWIINSSNINYCLNEYNSVLKTIPYKFCNENEAVSFSVMTSCQYHIISASSFSYWASLLSDHKLIIYPKFWYNPNNNRVNKIDTSSLFCNNFA